MKSNDDKRFFRVYDQSAWTATQYIWVDRETGVQYLVITSGQGAGVTPLIGADGKPLLYVEEDETDEGGEE